MLNKFLFRLKPIIGYKISQHKYFAILIQNKDHKLVLNVCKIHSNKPLNKLLHNKNKHTSMSLIKVEYYKSERTQNHIYYNKIKHSKYGQRLTIASLLRNV